MPILPRPAYLYRKIRSNITHDPSLSLTLTMVLREYDFELLDYNLKSASGNRSTTIFLNTSEGKKVLKRYKSSLGLSTIIQEHSILAHLEKINFPAPRLFPTNCRQTLIDEEGHRFAIYDFIEDGFMYHHYFLLAEQKNRFIRIAAEALGKLHQKLEYFMPQGYNPDGFKSKSGAARWRGLDWYLDRLNGCIARSSPAAQNDKDYILLARSAYLIEETRRLDEILGISELPRLINHGDYGPYNLLFQKNGPVYILDFEMARLEWRLVEIIRAWYRFCVDRAGLNLSRMILFLKFYQMHMPLRSEEFRLLPEVWKFINLRGVIRSWYQYKETRGDKSLADAIECLNRIDWINRHQQLLMKKLLPHKLPLS